MYRVRRKFRYDAWYRNAKLRRNGLTPHPVVFSKCNLHYFWRGNSNYWLSKMIEFSKQKFQLNWKYLNFCPKMIFQSFQQYLFWRENSNYRFSNIWFFVPKISNSENLKFIKFIFFGANIQIIPFLLFLSLARFARFLSHVLLSVH